MYASITNVSVSKLFIGSVIPGLLLVVCLMGYALVYAKRNNLPAHEKMPAKEVAKTFKSSIWALLMPIIILGGYLRRYLHRHRGRCRGRGLRPDRQGHRKAVARRGARPILQE